MSKSNFKNHPSNPAAQPFNINGKESKKRGWWLKGHNNPVKKEGK